MVNIISTKGLLCLITELPERVQITVNMEILHLSVLLYLCSFLSVQAVLLPFFCRQGWADVFVVVKASY